MTMSANKRRQLAELYEAASGICCYCDGATWLAFREGRNAARRRLGIVAGTPGAGNALTAARATREHLIKRADGGTDAGNLKLACLACNVRRGDSTPDEHRADMQKLVAAGLHPTNRPSAVPDPARHQRVGLKALRNLRAGIEPTTPPGETTL